MSRWPPLPKPQDLGNRLVKCSPPTLLLVVVSTFTMSLSSCAGALEVNGPRPAPTHCPLADYRTVVEQLAGDSGGHFATGSGDNFKAVRYLEGQFYAAGLVPGGQYGRFRQCFDIASGDRPCNVVGLVPGAGRLAGEAVVVAAHFDRHPTGRPAAATIGADDNASGAAGLVALATMLRRPVVSAPRRTLILVALNGSQSDRAGLTTYLRQAIVAPERTTLAIVLHRIGRLTEHLEVTLTGPDTTRRSASITNDARSEGVSVSLLPASDDTACRCDDAAPLAAKGVPTMVVTTGAHRDVGSRRDTAHKINWVGAGQVLNAVARSTHRAMYRL